jgi:hypothetical protein
MMPFAIMVSAVPGTESPTRVERGARALLEQLYGWWNGVDHRWHPSDWDHDDHDRDHDHDDTAVNTLRKTPLPRVARTLWHPLVTEVLSSPRTLLKILDFISSVKALEHEFSLQSAPVPDLRD